VKRRGGLPLNILITLCRTSAGKTLKGVRNNGHRVDYSFYESFVFTLGKALMQDLKKTFDAVIGSYMLALRSASSGFHRHRKALSQRNNLMPRM